MSRRFFRVLAAFGILCLGAQGAGAQLADCEKLLTHIGELPIGVYQIPSGFLAKANHSLEHIFGKDSLFIEIHDGHYSLRLGDRKFEGNPLYTAYQSTGKAVASETMLFHFPKVPEKALSEIRKRVEWGDQRIAMSCVDHVCRALDGAGIPVEGKSVRNVLLAPTTLKLLKSGIAQLDQEPLEYHLYVNFENETGTSIFQKLEEKDRVMLERQIRLFSRYADTERALEMIKRIAGSEAILDPETQKFIFAIFENRENPEIVMGLLSGYEQQTH